MQDKTEAIIKQASKHGLIINKKMIEAMSDLKDKIPITHGRYYSPGRDGFMFISV